MLTQIKGSYTVSKTTNRKYGLFYEPKQKPFKTDEHGNGIGCGQWLPLEGAVDNCGEEKYLDMPVLLILNKIETL